MNTIIFCEVLEVLSVSRRSEGEGVEEQFVNYCWRGDQVLQL